MSQLPAPQAPQLSCVSVAGRAVGRQFPQPMGHPQIWEAHTQSLVCPKPSRANAPNALLLDFSSLAPTNPSAFARQHYIAVLHLLPAFLWENYLIYFVSEMEQDLGQLYANRLCKASPAKQGQAWGIACVLSLKPRNMPGLPLALLNAAGRGL